MEERAIVHLDLDSFFVSVERLRNSALLHKPIIVGGSGKRGVVASCSYEARQFGVRSAMPIRMALKLCPDAIVIRGDMEAYSRYSEMVTEIIREASPLYEKTSIDEFYIDISGLEKYIGCYKWSTELRGKIRRETGLPISFGLAVNKLISKISTNEAKPNGQIMIPQGTERAYIGPMKVSRLPMVGEKTAATLHMMGVRTIETLRNIPMVYLQREFGENGKLLWERANAIDHSPVEPYEEQKSLSTERTFMEDTTDVHFLKSKLVEMTERLAFELRSMQRLTSCITVKIRYADFNTFTRQRKISYTANDSTLIRIAKELFDQLYERRQLIRLIGIRYSHLVNGSPQINLFEDTEELVNLYQAIDKIKNKFGSEYLKRAKGLE
ncbi:MAG: DNA polymerase IV [Cytophagaceae bacterium]|jgi:DNA polymerase-4|nr:DNA polymerase IV [Cytophagaceae bacterium]